MHFLRPLPGLQGEKGERGSPGLGQRGQRGTSGPPGKTSHSSVTLWTRDLFGSIGTEIQGSKWGLNSTTENVVLETWKPFMSKTVPLLLLKLFKIVKIDDLQAHCVLVDRLRSAIFVTLDLYDEEKLSFMGGEKHAHLKLFEGH